MRVLRPKPLRTDASVTVVVPCYRYGHHLPSLVAWALDQPGLDTRVLIVDDASPDDSGDRAEQLARADPQIRVLRHRANQGHIRTYNDGLREVETDYVMLLSADDLVPPGALTRAVALMEHHPTVGLVYGYARSFEGDPPEPRSGVRNWTVWRGSEWIGMSVRQARCFVTSPEVVMRTAALRSVGDYDARLPHSADFDLWLRTALQWQIGRVNGPDQALYRVHDANMHLTTFAGWVTDLQERRATFDILFGEHAASRPEIQRLRGVATRALATEALRRALAGHRDGLDATEVDRLARLSFEIDPGVLSTPRGVVWRLGPGRGRELPGGRPRRFASQVRHHLQWRRERRYGF